MTRWVLLGLTIIIATGVDLVAHRGDRVDPPRRALAWSGFWIVVAGCFAVGVLATLGPSRAEEFLAAYLLEKSLSVDNLLVFLLIFSRLQIPHSEQRRVLFWGITGAVVLRGTFIAAGVSVVTRWHFVLYGVGAFLAVAGVRLARRAQSPSEPRVVRWLRRTVPLTHGLVGHRFIAREDGRRAATPLLVALLAVELTDVMFALDSIPAAFGVTRDPFILASSNALAVLGLRALYVVAALALEGVRLLRFGVAAILVFVGTKMVAARWIDVSPAISLVVIATILTTTIVASLRKKGGTSEVAGRMGIR